MRRGVEEKGVEGEALANFLGINLHSVTKEDKRQVPMVD